MDIIYIHGPSHHFCDDQNGEDTRTFAKSSYGNRQCNSTTQELSFECLRRRPGGGDLFRAVVPNQGAAAPTLESFLATVIMPSAWPD